MTRVVPIIWLVRVAWGTVYEPTPELNFGTERPAWSALAHFVGDRPNDALAAARAAPPTAANRLFLAWLLEQLGRPDEVPAVLETAARDPNDPEGRRLALLELARRSTAPADRPRLNRCCDALVRESDRLNPADTIRLGRALLAAERFVEAHGVLSRPLPPEADHWLALAERGRGRTEEALAIARRRLAERADDAASWELVRELGRELGQPDRTILVLRRAAEQAGHPTAWRVTGDELASARPAEAEAAYRRALELAADPDAYRGLVALWVRQGRAEAIADRFEELSRDEQGGPHLRALVRAVQADAAAVRAVLPAIAARMRFDRPDDDPFHPGDLVVRLADAADELAAAEAILRAGLHRCPPRCEADYYSALNAVLTARRKHAERATLNQVGLRTARATSQVLFHYHLADALARTGPPELALHHADQAIQLSSDGSRPAAWSRKILVLLYLERYPDAIAECGQLLESAESPNEQRAARRMLALAYSEKGDAERSEFHYRRLLDDNPNDAPALNDLGYHFAEENRNLAEAEVMIRRALELERGRRKPRDWIDGENAAYLDSLAWVRYRRGDLTGAAELLRRALAEPDGRRDAVVWDHLGDVEAARGRLPEAVAAWRTALERAAESKRSVNDRRAESIRRKLAEHRPR